MKLDFSIDKIKIALSVFLCRISIDNLKKNKEKRTDFSKNKLQKKQAK